MPWQILGRGRTEEICPVVIGQAWPMSLLMPSWSGAVLIVTLAQASYYPSDDRPSLAVYHQLSQTVGGDVKGMKVRLRMKVTEVMIFVISFLSSTPSYLL